MLKLTQRWVGETQRVNSRVCALYHCSNPEKHIYCHLVLSDMASICINSIYSHLYDYKLTFIWLWFFDLVLLMRNLRLFQLCESETPGLELTWRQCCLLEFHICQTNAASWPQRMYWVGCCKELQNTTIHVNMLSSKIPGKSMPTPRYAMSRI